MQTSKVITELSCRNTTEDYPDSDLEWDKEPAVRTQAPLCLSTDIYEDSQTTFPASVPHISTGATSLSLLVFSH